MLSWVSSSPSTSHQGGQGQLEHAIAPALSAPVHLASPSPCLPPESTSLSGARAGWRRFREAPARVRSRGRAWVLTCLRASISPRAPSSNSPSKNSKTTLWGARGARARRSPSLEAAALCPGIRLRRPPARTPGVGTGPGRPSPAAPRRADGRGETSSCFHRAQKRLESGGLRAPLPFLSFRGAGAKHAPPAAPSRRCSGVRGGERGGRRGRWGLVGGLGLLPAAVPGPSPRGAGSGRARGV